MQGMDKLQEMERVMVDYFRDHLDEAGVGLEILPGVRELLEALKVIALWSCCSDALANALSGIMICMQAACIFISYQVWVIVCLLQSKPPLSNLVSRAHARAAMLLRRQET